MDKKPFHEDVAERLIEQLKAGTAPWQQSWRPGEPGAVLPMNPTTGKRYKGINALHLMAQSHSDQRWMTYKQAAAAGAQVRKGERGTPIQYWKFSEDQEVIDEAGRPVRDRNGEPVKETVQLERPRVFLATVFNGEQIDGLAPIQPRTKHEWSAIERAERMLQLSGALIHHGSQNGAFYRPGTDSIHMPERSRFDKADDYYVTALHELGHWTGHKTRLARDLAHPYGSAGYAKEELRAEIGSMILGDELGLGHDPSDHAAYVGFWIQALKDDPLEIFRAAADAEKIQGYVLGLEQQQTQKQIPHQAEAPMTETNESQSAYEAELGRLLRESTLTPGPYTPTEGVKNGTHAAVFVGDTAVILCGPSDDPASIAQAEALAGSQHLARVFRAADRDGAIHSGSVAGSHIPWAETEAGVVSKPSGAVEPGGQDGPLVVIVLNDQHKAVATNLCVTTETARILDAAAPELDDGLRLAALSRRGMADRADSLTEVWVLGHIKQDTFLDALEGLDRAQLERVNSILWEMLPMNHTNPFWQRNDLPEDFEPLETALDRGLDVIDGRLDKLDAQQQLLEAASTAVPGAPTTREARTNEMRLRNSPDGSDAQISAAKEVRKAAEVEAMQQKTFIDVPFKEKDQAKALGAKWDRQRQSWYVPHRVDVAAFAGWTKEDGTSKPDALPRSTAASSEGREYLAVPYGERDAAKAAGARWDVAAKSWYAGPNADPEKLHRWKPDPNAAEQLPAMNPREEFAEALRSLKCVVSGDHPIMDGEKHRISIEGEKPSEKAGSGFYVAHLDGHPAGYIKNNKSGIEMKWKAKGYVLDPEQRAQLSAEAASKLQARAAEQQQLHEQTALRVRGQLDGLKPIEQPTAYLQAKGIQCHPGAFTDAEGTKTYIPAIDADNRLWTMQYIREDGTKRFAKNSHKEGCFHAIGGLEAIAKAPAIVVSEGYATAATLAEALGFATVAAFDSGNLPAVAKALHARFPDKPIVIAGDDDQHLVATLGVNPGRDKMEEAARAVGGATLLPIFAPGERDAQPNRLTDFNDLATVSVFGAEGVTRQARAVVDLVIQRCAPVADVRQEEQHVQVKDKKRVPKSALDSPEPRRRRTAAKL